MQRERRRRPVRAEGTVAALLGVAPDATVFEPVGCEDSSFR